MTPTKKISALVLAAALAVLPLSACSEQETQDSGDVAMGRYVEETWDLPIETLGLSGLHKRPDGRIAMILSDNQAGEYEAVQRYFSTADGTDWQEETPDWVAELTAGARNIQYVDFNSKGEGAVVFVDYDDPAYASQLAYIASDGTLSYPPFGRNGNPFRDGDDMSFVYSLRTEEDGEEPPEADDPEETGEPPQVVLSEDDGGGDAESATDMDIDYYNTIYLDSIAMGEDGLIYAHSYTNVCSFDPATGEVVQLFLKGGDAFTLSGGQVVQLVNPDIAQYYNQVSPEETTLYFQDGNGKIVRELPASAVTGARYTLLSGGEDGSLCLADNEGLYRLAPGAENWEKIMEGALSSLSLPSMSQNDMLPHGDDEFLFLYYNNGPLLVNCVFSPDTPVQPDTELTVYALTNNQTLKQAVGAFRKNYPNVLVNIQSAGSGEDAMNGDEAIRVLATELLAGKGPDVFLLDNLPMDSYIEKGVLLDLSDIVGPMVESGELYEGIVRSLESDGGLYGVPIQFVLPTLWGTGEAVEAAGSLESLAAYAGQNPTFANPKTETLLYAFGRASMNSLVTEAGYVDVDNMETFLSHMQQIIGGAQQFNSVTDTFEEAEEVLDGAVATETMTAVSLDLMVELDYYDFDAMFGLVDGDADLMFSHLVGYSSMMTPNGAVYARSGGVVSYDAETETATTSLPDDEIPGIFRILPGLDGDVFYPTGIVGVNSASQNTDLAKEFVRTLLGEETQSVDLNNGFPVNRKAMDKLMETDNFMSVSTGYFDPETGLDHFVDFGYPSLGARKAVADAFEGLTTPALFDQSLMELIIDASQPLFTGDATAREVAEAIADASRTIALEE